MPIPATGEPAPRFRTTLIDGQPLSTDDLAGRFTTLCFFGSAGVPQMAAMAQAIATNSEVFDGLDHQFIGISIDPDDTDPDRGLVNTGPSVRWVIDGDQALSRLFGAAPKEGTDDEVEFQPLTVLLDANLRVLTCHKISDPAAHPAALTQFLNALPTFGPPRAASSQAPVIFVPMVFETEFCRRLIAHFEEIGGKPSGILEDLGDKTELTFDPARKRRLDLLIADK